MQDAAGEVVRLVRVMPNTPCLVGETAAAMCLGGKADDSDADTVRRLFDAVGKVGSLLRRATVAPSDELVHWEVGMDAADLQSTE